MSIVYGDLTCDGAKNLAETFSIQLAKGFNPLLNRLRASTDHSINLPMPKLFPLINYLGAGFNTQTIKPLMLRMSLTVLFTSDLSTGQPV